MLEELIIKNYALAESLRVEFTPGFNILSGETGAGKSVIIGALNLVIGESATLSSIRTGADEADVSAVIDISGNKDALLWLDENNVPSEENRVIIRRILKRNGRSNFYIQSSPITKADVISFTSLLFDIHGQNEHQSLLSSDNQLKLLDSYAHIEDEVENLKRDFFELADLKKKLQGLVNDEKALAREADIAAFVIKEIEDANLRPGEIESLEEEHRLLSQAEKMFELFKELHSSLSEIENGALSGLRRGGEKLRLLGKINPDFLEASSRIENAFFETEDVLEGIEKYKNNFNYSPERFALCEQRLSEIHRLRKKYGDTIEEIFDFLEKNKILLESAENNDEKIANLKDKISKLEKAVLSQAKDVSFKRKAAAEKLQLAVQNNLLNLGMPKALFVISVDQKLDGNKKQFCSSNGIDKVDFLISPNQGEPPKMLKTIASGGETSRVMLAIKSVLAEIDSVDCLVFDEIDSGIGGEIAVKVADYIFSLSKNKQIICISHLASIAVRADNHIKVMKNTVMGRTYTEIKKILGEERTVEIARMLSGDSNAVISLKHAEEMLSAAAMARED